MENHHFYGKINKWPFSIAMLNYQRVAIENGTLRWFTELKDGDFPVRYVSFTNFTRGYSGSKAVWDGPKHAKTVQSTAHWILLHNLRPKFALPSNCKNWHSLSSLANPIKQFPNQYTHPVCVCVHVYIYNIYIHINDNIYIYTYSYISVCVCVCL